MDELEKDSVSTETVAPILQLTEQHTLAEFGSPGALVHFIERFSGNGYKELLEQSVRKAPTVHAAWMLSRLINDAVEEKAAKYMQITESVYGGEICMR